MIHQDDFIEPYSRFKEVALDGGADLERIPELYALYASGKDGHVEHAGASFVLTQKEHVALWGQNETILWASGEPTLLVAGDGLGKTTIAQQVALARIRGGEVLGYPVSRSAGRVLYVAADRPKQAARSLKRMIDFDDPDEVNLINERLTIIAGPFDLGTLPEVCARLECDTVFVDTLQAVSEDDLETNQAGTRFYRQMEQAVLAGIEPFVLHHDRKGGKDWAGIREVYGSRWITAGCGSVLFLTGNTGSSEVWITHLKQPDAPVQKGKVYHDHRHGRSYLESRAFPGQTT